MSQYDNPYGGPDQNMGGYGVAMPVRTSPLAIAALICSLIFCCPLTTIPGVLMGLIALVTIGGNPARKGRGIAVLAIIIGIVATVAQVYAWFWVRDTFIQPVVDGPRAAMVAGTSGNPDEVRAAFHGSGATATDDEIAAFFGELVQRYGQFQSIGFDPNGQTQANPAGNPVQVFPYIAVFDQKRVSIEAELIFADQQTGAWVIKWGYLHVIDPDLGDLVFPPDAPIGPATGRGTPPSSPPPAGDDDAGDNADDNDDGEASEGEADAGGEEGTER